MSKDDRRGTHAQVTRSARRDEYIANAQAKRGTQQANGTPKEDSKPTKPNASRNGRHL